MTLVHAATEAERARAARRVRQNVARVQEMSERDIEATLRDLRDTRARLVARLAGRTEFDQAFARSMIADVDREVERLKQQLGPRFASMFRRIMEDGSAHTVGMIADAAGRSLLVSPGIDANLVNFARENSADLVQQIGSDLRTRINTALRRGATGSSDTADVGRAIGDVVREAGRNPGAFGNIATQTERILRTETARLYEGAAEAERVKIERDSGLKLTKVWVHVSGRIVGAEPRPDHALLNGVEIPNKEHFNVGAGPKWSRVSYEEAQRRGGTLGFRASGPQDSTLPAGQVVNCRCATAAGIEE